MPLISWGFLDVMKAVESSSQQSLTVANMKESKDLFMQMQDQYKRFFSMMLQRYICALLLIVELLRSISRTIKHLKSCYQVNSNKKVADNNKICSICHKYFLQKSNRDCHRKTVHQDDSEIADPDENVQRLNDDEYFDEELPNIVYNVAKQSQVSDMEIEQEVSISFQPSESGIISPFPTLEPSASFSSLPTNLPAALTPASSPSLPTDLPAALTTTLSSSLLTDLFAAPTIASSSSLPTDQPDVPTVTLSASYLSKNLCLEHYLNKIITSFNYSSKVNKCVIDYLKLKLKDNKKKSVLYIKEYFGVKC